MNRAQTSALDALNSRENSSPNPLLSFQQYREMSAANNKKKSNGNVPRPSGLRPLREMAQATDLNDYFTPTQISQLAQTHPDLNFKIGETGVLKRHRKEWLIRWLLPGFPIEEVEDVHLFATVAPTEEIALQHFILADTADKAIVAAFIEDQADDPLQKRYQRFRSQLLKKYPPLQADGEPWFMNVADPQLVAAIQPMYHAFLQANLGELVELVNGRVIVQELLWERTL